MQQNGTSSKELPEVFRELQNIRSLQTQIKVCKKVKKTVSTLNNIAVEKLTKALVWTTAVICVFILSPSTNAIFAASNVKSEEVFKPINSFEANENVLNMHNIVSNNTGLIETKQLVTEEREFSFGLEYKENDLLPKGEEVIVQEGINGKEIVTAVQTYKNDEMVEENIIEKEKIEDSVAKIIEKGTSVYLANKKMHIGDIIYTLENVALLKEAADTSEKINEVTESMDVKLLGLEGDFCKVSYNGKEGYIVGAKLTSAALNPEVVEKNKLKKNVLKVSYDMPLNQKSGLTLDDYKKMLSNNVADISKIFENNSEHFYNAEQKYNVNGVFLAAVGIHESAWGTSTISKEKKNLFGYGAYDRDPYNMSYTFEEYKDGIELVAKVFSKYYINPKGTEIYDNQKAESDHYNGSNLEGVNKKYSTDENWSKRVYYYMEYLYGKLK